MFSSKAWFLVVVFFSTNRAFIRKLKTINKTSKYERKQSVLDVDAVWKLVEQQNQEELTAVLKTPASAQPPPSLPPPLNRPQSYRVEATKVVQQKDDKYIKIKTRKAKA